MRADLIDPLDHHFIATDLFEYVQHAIDQHIHFVAAVTFSKH